MNVQDEKGRVLFYRRLINKNAGTNGGNLKLRDCYDHITFSKKYQPAIYFSEDTIWHNNEGNYWNPLRSQALEKWQLNENDILFFSGTDWLVLAEAERNHPSVPIINIVQPRHTRSIDKRQQFLKHPAIRIAKSNHGAGILRAHGVNGPIYVVPDTIDLSLMPAIPENKDIDILVLGLKQPAFAEKLFDLLQQWNVDESLGLTIEIQRPPKFATRQEFLQLLSRAKIAACIPLEEERGAEGFYLPALEAMALECLVVCPHSVGNIDHCLDGFNCIVPEFTVEGLFESTKLATKLEETKKSLLLQNGLSTVDKHRIEHERKAVLELVDQAHVLWNQKELFSLPKEQGQKLTLFQRIKKMTSKNSK